MRSCFSVAICSGQVKYSLSIKFIIACASLRAFIISFQRSSGERVSNGDDLTAIDKSRAKSIICKDKESSASSTVSGNNLVWLENM